MNTPRPHLMVHDERTGNRRGCPPGAVLRVGRPKASDQPDLACDDKHVSRLHCEIHGEAADSLKIVDKSSYGTFVNGTRVEGTALARAGDEITLGHDYPLKVVSSVAPGPGTPTPPTADWGKTRIEPGPGEAPVAEGERVATIGKRYEIVRELGRGGMGAVYEAVDADRGGVACAIKILHGAGRASSNVVQRFRREAQIGEELSAHEGIVRIYDLGTVPETGELYCAMDLVKGRTLTHFVAEKPPLAARVRIVAEVARAIAFAHEKQILHRDLKPDNVLVDESTRARLTDFGIGKAADEGGLTATGSSLGTPTFMAPEQLEDAKRAGPPADVYGLGGLLYFVLTGGPPHKGETLVALLREIKTGRLVPPSKVNAETPAALEALCLRCLAHEASGRPDAKTVAATLDSWLAAPGGGAS